MIPFSIYQLCDIGKLLNLSEPQLSHTQNENNISIYFKDYYEA